MNTNELRLYFLKKEEFPALLLLFISALELVGVYYLYEYRTMIPYWLYVIGGVVVIALLIDIIWYTSFERRNRRPDDRVIDAALLENRQLFINDLTAKSEAMKVDSPLFIFPVESSFIDGSLYGFKNVLKRRGTNFVDRYSTVKHSVMALFNNRIRTITHYVDLISGQSSVVTEDTLLIGIDRIILTESGDGMTKSSILSLYGSSYPQPISMNLSQPGISFEIIDEFMKSIRG